MKSSVTPVTPVTNQKEQRSKHPSQADRILQYVNSTNKFEIRLFCDQRSSPYIQIYDIDTEIAQIHKVKSQNIRLWLTSLLWRNEKKAPSDKAIRSAITVLMAQAHEGPTIPLYNRVAKDGENIWVDMCNDSWWAIKINKDGWSITRPPILFKRFKHQKPIPYPKKRGSVKPLLFFLKFDNLGDQLLFIVKAISWLVPDIAHLISQVYGKQGGGKSILQKAVKHIIDPSAIQAFASIPKDKRELIRILDQHYVVIFDNISYLPSGASDCYCSAVTGAGQSYRQLYTDSEEVIYEYRRCIGINGINIPGTQPDILDRSGLFEQNLSQTDRLTEAELDHFLEKNAPEILGGMLDILVKALQIYPSMSEKVGKLERLADFTVWGCSITEAMGLDYQLFLDSYRANINNHKIDAINSSPVADCLISFFGEQQGTLSGEIWSGTASQLYTIIKEEAKKLKISTSQKAFPRTPFSLGKHLTKLEPNLPVIGFKLEKDRTGEKRTLRFLRVKKEVTFNKPLNWGLGTNLVNYLDLGLKTVYKPEERDPKDPCSQNLQESLDEFLRCLGLLERTNDGEPVDFYILVKELFKNEWKPSDIKKVSEILKRDKMIFEPRPGFLKTVRLSF